MSQNSFSGESSESAVQRTVTISVIRDTGTKVQLMFKAHGLKKRKSLINSIVTVFKKPSSPSRLLSNGRFTKFELKPNSLYFVLHVQRENKPMKSNHNANRTDIFVCEIKQFPTGINPDSAEFEASLHSFCSIITILEPASGECFILLSLIKVDNLKVNWKEFLESNGTLDVTAI